MPTSPNIAAFEPVLTPSAVVAPVEPLVATSPIAAAPPAHTIIESTLAPTSEFMRYLLAALPSRYVLRGLFGLAFNEKNDRPARGLGKAILDGFGKIGEFFNKKHGWSPKTAEAAGYNAALGIGSFLLTASYSLTVYKDIKHIFSEAVGEEFGKPADQVTSGDINRSQNRIVQGTLKNFWGKLGGRLITDALFIPAAFIRHTAAGDFALGIKGVQLFADTWKRKTTMFEDLVTFVNNKINPHNGLGQAIGVGEVFDLYQHYTDIFNPTHMFKNVLERGEGEGRLWARSQPIFQRLTELMNLTYAYKHSTLLNQETGETVNQADFALPKFVYLLGHDLIDVRQPEKTLLLIEVANARGIPAVKEAQILLDKGVPMTELLTRYGVTLPQPKAAGVIEATKNAVLPKGSTLNPEQATLPVAMIDARTTERQAQQTGQLSPVL